METLNNKDTGKCLVCSTAAYCKTCRTSATFCTSCPTGYSQVATKCISDTSVGFSLTFQSPTASSSQAELASFQLILEEIRGSLAGRLGSPYNTNPDSISFGTIASGSVTVTGQIDASSSNANQVLNTANTITASNTAIGSFQMVSSTYTASGFTTPTTTTSSSVNLPLILGIAIPVAVIFLVVVVVIIVKIGRGKNAISDR